MDILASYTKFREGLNPNILLMFRIGEHYSFFFSDAEIIAKELGLEAGRKGGYLMIGCPVPEKEDLVRKILAAGYSVAEVEIRREPDFSSN